MEETYFSSFFHQKTGVRFIEWLHHVRVERAMGLLSRTDQRVTDVAYEVGFCDLRTFERAFKRETNLTPRDFKKRYIPA
jgi:AraC-like DNA-binding protein